MRKLSVIIIVILLVPIIAISQQQDKKNKQDQQSPQKKQDPVDDGDVIKLDAKLVNILFSAQDKQNHYINDLQQKDIEILEDGIAQEIFTFKRETDLPLTIAILVDVSGSEQQVIP